MNYASTSRTIFDTAFFFFFLGKSYLWYFFNDMKARLVTKFMKILTHFFLKIWKIYIC